MTARLSNEHVAALRVHRGLMPTPSTVEQNALVDEILAMRALLNGGPCATCEGAWIYVCLICETVSPTEQCHRCGGPARNAPCPNPACKDGRVPGVIERLEAAHLADFPVQDRIVLDRSAYAAVIADLKEAVA